ncbi:MAG: type II toxin-antitoxin system HigB family toxin [Rhodospirillaceae bacterium]|nr:type II toxin-antitoxin system HigB family toxin [Rhodospirillaceae bacterium]
MLVIAKRTLVAYWGAHAETKQPLLSWYDEARNATWHSWTDIKAMYSNASALNDGRVCFDIKGGNYRLIVHVHYRSQIVFIRFVGTHAEYDKIDGNTV